LHLENASLNLIKFICEPELVEEHQIKEFQLKYLTNDELGDMFFFLLTSTGLYKTFYEDQQFMINDLISTLSKMKESKLRHMAFVLDVLKSLDFTGDVAKNVLSKYL